MVKMWVFLLFIAAVIVWPGSAQGEQVYLATVDNWSFYKIRATGPMTDSNVKATCEAAGMRYPCFKSGTAGCTSYWTSDCIAFDAAGVSCSTHNVLSDKLCGHTDPWQCQPLDDTFVYMPDWRTDDSACGVVNGGYCTEGANYNNMYALCAVATCARSNPCVHGICTDGDGSYTCSCENGWTGYNCEIDIDECASSPCVHGTCTDGVFYYTCTCEPGWTGHHCHEDIDECASSPCLLGGTCLDHVGGYSCVCPENVAGKYCDTAPFAGQCYQFSSTAAAHPDAARACQANNGHLADVTDLQQQSFLADMISASTGLSSWLAFTSSVVFHYSNGSPLSAPLQWSSSEPAAPCDLCVFLDSSDSFLAKTAPCTEQHNYVCQDAMKPCGQNICQNGGICGACFNDSAAFCECPDGFDGKTCEINIDECAPGPCQNGGSCQDGINSYHCICPTGYQGAHCESDMDWCSQVQCPLGFVCQDFTFYFLCAHPSPVTRGLPYQCSSASCPAGMYCTQEGVAAFSCKPE